MRRRTLRQGQRWIERVRWAVGLLAAVLVGAVFGRFIERRRMLESAAAIALTDPLTGLANRRAWEEELRREVARARRHSERLALVMLDLDHFKALNDTHGHQAGAPVRARAVGPRLLVRIVDRGPGIAGPELERIFAPFHRGTTATACDDGHAGSGLGLAVVRGFVEANGGRTWAESLPGQGATFVVELPLEPAAAPTPEPAGERTAAAEER